jgi:hypothetical protein
MSWDYGNHGNRLARLERAMGLTYVPPVVPAVDDGDDEEFAHLFPGPAGDRARARIQASAAVPRSVDRERTGKPGQRRHQQRIRLPVPQRGVPRGSLTDPVGPVAAAAPPAYDLMRRSSSIPLTRRSPNPVTRRVEPGGQRTC